MIESLRASWRRLAREEPGSRFQAEYRARRAAERSRLGRLLRVALGIVVMGAGFVFLPAPGPGMLIILGGAALLARESRLMARLLDRLEVRGRRIARGVAGLWRRAVVPVRILIGFAGGVLVAAVAAIAYLVVKRL